MRLLIVNWQDKQNPQAGGAELHLHEVFGRLAARGHTVDLLCSGFKDAPDRATLDGIRVFRTAGRYTFQFHAKKFYNRHLAAQNYDVIVEDLNKIPLYTPRWNAQKTVALVHHLFGSTVFREAMFPVAALVWLSERPMGHFYRNTPFQSVSDSTTQDLVQRGIPRQNIRVIFNGVDTVALTPNASERSSTPLFAYLGRVKKYKRVDLVIRAFAKVESAEARLEIAGAGDNRPALEKLVASLGLESRVKFLGRISEEDKLSLLRRSWATVLASPKEGWGISNLETAACGTAVIAVHSPGIRESVVDGETGYLVPSSASLIAEKMNLLIADPSLVETLGAAGRKFAEGFTWERAADETEADLEAVIRGSGR